MSKAQAVTSAKLAGGVIVTALLDSQYAHSNRMSLSSVPVGLDETMLLVVAPPVCWLER